MATADAAMRHALAFCLVLVQGSVHIASHQAWAESLQQVDELLASVPSQNRERCESVLRGLNRRGFSQAWQDWFLYRNFFAGQRKGLYIDIGTNDPIRISNTFFLTRACTGKASALNLKSNTMHGSARTGAARLFRAAFSEEQRTYPRA